MSVHVSSLVWKADIGNYVHKLVLLKLADHAKEDGADVRPSLTAVAQQCGCDIRTVQRAVRWAQQEGLLVCDDAPEGRIRTYHFDMEALRDRANPRHTDRGVTQTGVTDRRGDPRHTDTPPPAHRHPINKNRHTTVLQPSSLEGLWERFFAAYPKRQGSLEKAKGKAKFFDLGKKGTDLEAVIAGALAYAKHCDLTNATGTKYVKQIPTFLNGRAWEEDYTVRGKSPVDHLARIVAEAEALGA